MNPDQQVRPVDSPMRDNNPWGAPIEAPPPPESFRIYAQNINGIPMKDLPNQLHQIGQFVTAYKINFLSLMETNLDWDEPTIITTIQQTIRKY